MPTEPITDYELQRLADRYNQILAWEEAVPNSANSAAQIDEIETEVIRRGYTLEEFYAQLENL